MDGGGKAGGKSPPVGIIRLLGAVAVVWAVMIGGKEAMWWAVTNAPPGILLVLAACLFVMLVLAAVFAVAGMIGDLLDIIRRP